MEMIHFQGLNCFHDCLMTLAQHLGIDFSLAFWNLWSETDFRYDSLRETYLSKRVITNLEALGARAVSRDCFSPAEELALVRDGDWLIAGVDAFFIPWNPFFHGFHGPHYLLLQKGSTEALPSFDPTYQLGGQALPRETLLNHCFDLIRVAPVPRGVWKDGFRSEAREVLRSHPLAREALLESFRAAAKAGDDRPAQCLRLAKYADTMLSHRHLFAYYWKRHGDSRKEEALWGSDAFSRWAAVKNGLYKAAAIGSPPGPVLAEVSALLHSLLEDEIQLAQRLL